MVAGQDATATVWTPDLLQSLAQGRQVTIFTNKGIGLSTEEGETQNSTIAGRPLHMHSLPAKSPFMQMLGQLAGPASAFAAVQSL